MPAEYKPNRAVVFVLFFLIVFGGLSAVAGLPTTDTVEFDALDEVNILPGPGDQSVGLGELVSLFNGNLFLSQQSSPIVPSADGAVASLVRSYNSHNVRAFEIETSGGGRESHLSGQGWVGLGWTVHLGRVFMTPRHHSAGNYTVNSFFRYFEGPDGGRYRITPSRSALPHNVRVSWVPPVYNECPGYSCVFEPDGICCNNSSGDPVPGICDNPECTCNCPPAVLISEGYYRATMPDGTELILDHEVPADTTANGWVKNLSRVGFYTTSITDVHGRTIQIEYDDDNANFPEAIERVLYDPDPSTPDDEVELITAETCTAADVPVRCPLEGMLKSVRASGFKGSRQTPLTVQFEFYYSSTSITDASGTRSVPLLARVELPEIDGVPAGEVSYDYGTDMSLEPGTGTHGPLLTRITHATGAAVEIRYGSWDSGTRDSGSSTTNRNQVGVDKVTVFPNGLTTTPPNATRYSTSWSREFTLPDCADPEENRVSTYVTTRPDGRRATSEFNGHPCNHSWEDWGVFGTVNSTILYDNDGTTPYRTIEHSWDYETDPETGEEIEAIQSVTETTYHDDDGSCFGGTSGGGPRRMQVSGADRNDWNQWRVSYITGDYFPANYRHLTYTNFHSPDNVVFANCSVNDHIVGMFDEHFVEKGIVGDPANTQRFEEAVVFDCYGRVTSARSRPQWENKTTTLGQPVVPNEPVSDGDLVATRNYGTQIYPVSLESSIHGQVSVLESNYTWSYGQIATASPTGLTYHTADLTYDESGLVSSASDPESQVTTFDYDALGRLTSIDPPGSIEYSSQPVYPSLNEVRLISPPNQNGEFDPDDTEQVYSAVVLDGMGRAIEEHRSVASSDLSFRIKRYDPFGRGVFTSEWLDKGDYDGLSGLTHATWTTTDGSYRIEGIPIKDGLPVGTTTFYGVPSATQGEEHNPLRATPDALGRSRRVSRADGETVLANYCGAHEETHVLNVQTTIDGSSETATTRRYYDGHGQLILLDAPVGSADAEYRYDARGNLTYVNLIENLPEEPYQAWLSGSVPVGQERNFQYDAAGRVMYSNNPEGGRTDVVSYNPLGTPLQWQDAQAATRGYFFENVVDSVGRVVETRRVQGAPEQPATADIELIGSSGDFEESSDLVVAEVPASWVEGAIATDTFTVGDSAWQQASYGGCLQAPPGGTSNGGLYLGSSCSYKATPAEPQAVRYALDGVGRSDVLGFEYFRHVRAGSGAKDEFAVYVVPQSEGNSVADARYLFALGQSQASYATWRSVSALRLGDVFSSVEWPEEESGVPATRDLYLYFVFTKGDAAQSGVGLGVIVDDISVGRKATEKIAEYAYDEDVCAGASPPVACAAGVETQNRFRGSLARAVSYQGGRQVSKDQFVYRGLNGRLSGVETKVDWAGMGDSVSFESHYDHNARGAITTWSAAYRPGFEDVRAYENHYKRGFLDGLTSVAGRAFVAPSASPPSIEYSAAGVLNGVKFANGTSQHFDLDSMHRILGIESIGPVIGVGTQTLWTSGGAGSYQYDGAGNIKQIGSQKFAYDRTGRLAEARVLPQAADPLVVDPYHVTYAYDAYGNQVSRSWARPIDPSEPAPAGMNLTFMYEDASRPNRNQVLDSPFAYDLNGQLTRLSVAGVSAAATWTPTGQLASWCDGVPGAGPHRVSERYYYDSAGHRLVRFPDKGDGRPVITVRDPIGNAQSDYVVDPSDGSPKLHSDFLYGVGRLLVERRVTWDPPEFQANSALLSGGIYTFDVVGQMGSGSYLIDIRAPSGYTNELDVSTTSNRIELPESAFSLDEVNYIRVREVSSGEYSAFSTPVTLSIDSSVNAQSPNQVRAVSVGRVGTDVLVSYGLLGQNTKSTSVYFERVDTGVQILQTPVGVPPGTTSYTISEQSLPVVCGEMTTMHNGAFSIGADMPPVHLAQNVESDPEACGGEPPEVPEYSFQEIFHHRDHLSSLRVTTDDGGWGDTWHDFYPYGDELSNAGAGALYDGSRRFTDHERDELTANDYMKGRYKHSGLPMFSSPDLAPGNPLRPETLNRYAYVHSNPVNMVDPSGQAAMFFWDRTDRTTHVGLAQHTGMFIQDPHDASLWWKVDTTPHKRNYNFWTDRPADVRSLPPSYPIQKYLADAKYEISSVIPTTPGQDNMLLEFWRNWKQPYDFRYGGCLEPCVAAGERLGLFSLVDGDRVPGMTSPVFQWMLGNEQLGIRATYPVIVVTTTEVKAQPSTEEEEAEPTIITHIDFKYDDTLWSTEHAGTIWDIINGFWGHGYTVYFDGVEITPEARGGGGGRGRRRPRAY